MMSVSYRSTRLIEDVLIRIVGRESVDFQKVLFMRLAKNVVLLMWDFSYTDHSWTPTILMNGVWCCDAEL